MSVKIPPLMLQYRQIKADHPDAILFFQVGDFYEMFYDDAKQGAELLELTLTTRDKNSLHPVPLCGLPIHAAQGYIARLIKAGRNVAVCDQVEEAGQGKGIVKREVVRVITPGTLTEDHLLEGGQANYLAAVCGDGDGLGLAYVDVSTGDFRLMDLNGDGAAERLIAELARIECRELLVPETHWHPAPGEAAWPPKGPVVRVHPGFDVDRGRRSLCKHLGVNRLDGYGITGATPSVGSAGALLGFLTDTQKGVLPQITAIRSVTPGSAMLIDADTLRNLEITRRGVDGSRHGTLLALLDRSRTPMGARFLKDWLTAPLLEPAAIVRRQEAVSWLVDQPHAREAMREQLSGIADLERLAARVAMGRATPRDLAALGHSLAPLPDLKALLPPGGPDLLSGMLTGWDNLDDVRADITATLAEEVPAALKDGGVIRDGVSAELDEVRRIGSDVRGVLARMEADERKRSGIESLKIRYNNVFGYYLEVTKAKLAERGVPDDYIRKQTLVNAERYITPELKELETRILSAGERMARLEAELFSDLRDRVAKHVPRLQWVAAAVGALDTLSSLARVAQEGGWTRPEVVDGRTLEIENGRHPVVEAMLPAGTFVANDTNLSEAPVVLITGPNMAGKSTYLRQVAVICLLAQIGSHVPATSARVGVVDRVFSRIGASDNMTEGLSTFMVEMTETANILHNATDRSLVILDEIGRGTSTFDGLSIAWAVAEYLHDHPGARTLFATHYHELTDLAVSREGVRNVNVQVREWNDEIVFLHRIVDGAADRSYGIQVARLAGLPKTVIDRARQVLSNLEGGELDQEGRPRLAAQAPAAEMAPADPRAVQFGLFSGDRHPVLEQIKSLDLSRMTPLEAMNVLDRLQREL
ncbi:MAG: DNA mismatch repair protein MutS [Nitrospirota bacterium]|nr:DNA mismatch repair protein MutS [Nitrospirota bacterium]